MTLPEWSDPDRRDEALARVARAVAEAGGLTKNELGVIFCLSHGMKHAEIERTLFMGKATAKWHLRHVYVKLDARNATHAVATALRLGLID